VAAGGGAGAEKRPPIALDLSSATLHKPYKAFVKKSAGYWPWEEHKPVNHDGTRSISKRFCFMNTSIKRKEAIIFLSIATLIWQISTA
jgi:hypothetical protein